MRITTEAPLNIGLGNQGFFPITANRQCLNLIKLNSCNFLQYNSITRVTKWI